MKTLIRYLFLMLFAFLSGQVSRAADAELPAGCAINAAAPPRLDFSPAPDLATFKEQLLYYRCTRYDLDIEIVMRDARNWLAERASQVINPAIVLDIDETSLSNWTRLYYKDGYPYIPHDACDLANAPEACGDIDWQWSEQAPALQPVLGLYKLARCINVPLPCTKVDVYFVSGRHEGSNYVPKLLCPTGKEDSCKLARTPREWTLENLRKSGFTDVTDDYLRMRKDSHGSVSEYKTNERIAIEDGGKVTIIANVGDQESDLAGSHAERTFKLPNPFYFIP